MSVLTSQYLLILDEISTAISLVSSRIIL